jgi:hypothetical protein
VNFGFPLGLLALGALAPLVAAYFLRRRQRPRVVSALFLWRSPSQRAQAGPRFERFSREASLGLEILAVITAALFLADLRCGKDVPKKHLVVVVDGGLSLSARGVAEKVRNAVAKLAQDEGAAALTILESGVKPTMLAGPQVETARALALLEAWRPMQPSHDVAPTLLMARELSSDRGARIWFFTDGPLTEAMPPEVKVHSVGTAAGNLALVAASRHDAGGVAAVTVRVANFSAEPREVPVRFVGNGAEQTQSLKLQPGASAVVRVGLKTGSPIEVSLPADDALGADSTATLLAAPTPELSVGLLEGLDGSAEAAIKRFMQIAPGLKRSPPFALTFGPPGSQARVTLGAQGPLKSFVGPFFTQKGDPLLDDVQLAGIVWTLGANPPGRALVTAGEAVLLAQEENGALHFNLDLSRSNLQRTPAWPVLLGNVLQLARLRAPGLPRRHLMLGEEVPVVTEAGARWALKGPDGSERAILGSGAVRLPALSAPGRWALLKDGKEVDALAVLPIDPRESDLRTRGPFEVEPTAGSATLTSALSRARPLWPVGLLLVLLMIDFWLTAREARSSAVPRAGAA